MNKELHRMVILSSFYQYFIYLGDYNQIYCKRLDDKLVMNAFVLLDVCVCVCVVRVIESVN